MNSIISIKLKILKLWIYQYNFYNLLVTYIFLDITTLTSITIVLIIK